MCENNICHVGFCLVLGLMPAYLLAILLKELYNNFISWVVATGLINEVATLVKIKLMRNYGKYIWAS